jgi:hypothetical protein
MLVALRDRSGGGAAVQGHHANKGGRGSLVRRLRLDHRGKRCSGAGWQPCLVSSCLMQHGMQPMNPCMRIRLTHPDELALPLLKGVLLHVGQDAASCVGHRRHGTGVIRTVAATRARLPITRTVMPGGHQRLLNIGSSGLKFAFRESSPRW